MIKIDDVPKKRLQSLLRSQMCIEYLIKLVKLCWEGFFDKQADLIKEMRDDKGVWSGKFAQVDFSVPAVLQLSVPVVCRRASSHVRSRFRGSCEALQGLM